MTEGPSSPASPDPQQPDPAQANPASPPPPPPPPPAYGQPPAYAPPPAPGGAPAGAYGVSSTAPYGLDPRTGIPYSDKQKLIAGLLNILLPFGVGRFYIGDTKTGVLQLVVTVVTCGLGSLWSLIDGILMLVHDDTKDSNGYILRP
jgi:TM2 domain-containing membrane protein YozV